MFYIFDHLNQWIVKWMYIYKKGSMLVWSESRWINQFTAETIVKLSLKNVSIDLRLFAICHWFIVWIGVSTRFTLFEVLAAIRFLKSVRAHIVKYLLQFCLNFLTLTTPFRLKQDSLKQNKFILAGRIVKQKLNKTVSEWIITIRFVNEAKLFYKANIHKKKKRWT